MTWSPPVEGVPDFYVVTVNDSDQIGVTTTEDLVYTPCAEIIVKAVFGDSVYSGTLLISPTETDSFEVWIENIADSTHPSGIAFDTLGTHAYSVYDTTNLAKIDYYLAPGPKLMSTKLHTPTPLNSKGCSVSQENGTFNTLKIVSPTSLGLYQDSVDLVEGGLYGLFLDRNDSDYDVTDYFGKAQVISVTEEKVTFKFAIQTKAGLRWVVK